jgi:hypothetical protein
MSSFIGYSAYEKTQETAEIGSVRSVQLVQASARTPVDFRFYPGNEMFLEDTHNHFMLESIANCRPEPGSTGRDGVRAFPVRGKLSATMSALTLGDAHIPENQKVVL